MNPHSSGTSPRSAAGKRGLWIVVASAVLLCGAIAAALLFSGYVRLAGAWRSLSSESLTLTEWDMAWTARLARFHDLKTLDLRGAALDVADAPVIQAALPAGAALLWRVPIGGKAYDSDSVSLTIPDLPAAEADRLLLFPRLQTADLRGSTCYPELLALREQLPDCALLWSIDVCGKTALSTDTALDLSGTAMADTATLAAALDVLPALTELDLRQTGLSEAQTDDILARYPALAVRRTVSIAGQAYDSVATRLDLSGKPLPDTAALTASLARFPALTEADLHDTGLSQQQISALRTAFPTVRFLWTITLYGRDFESDAERIDLRGCRIDDLSAFTDAVELFPNLNYVDMCDCGPSNEEMDALNRAYPEIKIVWMIHLHGNAAYNIRTDAVAFTTKLKANPDNQLRPESADALKYCTDLEALDLGHNRVDDISILRNLKKLRYLILAGCGVEDLSPLAELENLEYVELFANKITDLTPLANKKKLLDVNISNNNISDLSPLYTNPQIERLWASRNPLDEASVEAVQAALPACAFDFSAWSATGNGWREHPRFFEMRAFFGLPPID